MVTPAQSVTETVSAFNDVYLTGSVTVRCVGVEQMLHIGHCHCSFVTN